MDDAIARNLDTQRRVLDDIEQVTDALLAGEDVTVPPTAGSGDSPQTFGLLTVANDQVRVLRGWSTVDLDTAMNVEQAAAYAVWQGRQRRRWTSEDVLAVGLAAMLGCAATWFDTTLDAGLSGFLKNTKSSDLLKGWERDGAWLLIDYNDPGFGGPGHRVRSSGHDLARLFSALRQILNGQFEGIAWTDGVRTVEVVERESFKNVDSIATALLLWAKHLAADAVTPTSLPLPGWTLLYELPWRDARMFAHDVYRGSSLGNGLNVRSGIMTPSLCVAATEVVVRTHIHGRAWSETGSALLNSADQARRDEMLLAAYSLVGAASLGKAVTRMLLLEKSPMALRHINVPVLVRVGCLALGVVGDMHDRATSGAPEWDDLLARTAYPWQLDTVRDIEIAAAEWI